MGEYSYVQRFIFRIFFIRDLNDYFPCVKSHKDFVNQTTGFNKDN